MKLTDADAARDAINEKILKVYEIVRKPDIELDEEMKIRVEQAIATYCEASLIVSKMPTVDAVPVRHGKWIHEVRYTIDSLHSYQQYRCSECGMTYITNTKYCPNCGARMVEE